MVESDVQAARSAPEVVRPNTGLLTSAYEPGQHASPARLVLPLIIKYERLSTGEF
jgi:hypothetical protein